MKTKTNTNTVTATNTNIATSMSILTKAVLAVADMSTDTKSIAQKGF